MPESYRTYQAATLLHCPPWQLEERTDGWYWENHAISFANAERMAQDNWAKIKGKR